MLNLQGIFPNKTEVAVKQLFDESQQSIDEFIKEKAPRV